MVLLVLPLLSAFVLLLLLLRCCLILRRHGCLGRLDGNQFDGTSCLSGRLVSGRLGAWRLSPGLLDGCLDGWLMVAKLAAQRGVGQLGHLVALIFAPGRAELLCEGRQCHTCVLVARSASLFARLVE